VKCFKNILPIKLLEAPGIGYNNWIHLNIRRKRNRRRL
jgi:hypothetical protein